MRNRGLLITTILFFLIVKTTYYWEGKLDLLAFPVFIFLVVVYVGLFIELIRQFIISIKENFSNKSRFASIGLLTFVLALTFYKPLGIIQFGNSEGEDLLIAQGEEADCMTTFKLKDDSTFRERNVCYGVTEVIGTYRIANDTIYLENVKRGKQEDVKFEFGVIEELEFYTENKYALKLFTNKKDTVGFMYFIGKNDLNVEPLIKPNRLECL